MSTETEPTTKTIILALEVPDTTKVPVAPDYALRAMAYGIMQTFDAKTLPGWDGPLLVLDGEDERDARAVLGVLTRRRHERARKGGEAVVAKYGPEHMGAISKGRKPTPRYTPTKS